MKDREPPFPDFPDEARVWIYVADRPIGSGEADSLLDRLAPFLASWTSHRRVVRGGAAVVEGRFLILCATAPDGDLSGCGIDKSVHQIDEAGRELGLAWSSSLDVSWRDASGAVRVGPRSAFREGVRTGAIGPDTRVFDLSVGTLGELRRGRFERPASASWHARVFGLEPSAA